MADIPGRHNEPRIWPVENNLYMFMEPLVYEWETPIKNRLVFQRLTIAASPIDPYVFDGASIPAEATLLTKWLPFVKTIYPMGLHIYSTAFHDFIWEYQGRIPIGSHDVYREGEWVDACHIWKFTESNRLFGRQMKEDGVGKTERLIMQATVQTPIGYFNWCQGDPPPDARPLGGCNPARAGVE